MRDADFQQLSIIYVEQNRAWSYCCFHKDTIRPNLSISLTEQYWGKCKCWACGKEEKLNNTQMALLNLQHSDVYKNDKYSLQTRWRQFSEDCHDNLQKFPLLKLGLAKQLNVSTRSLDEWLVGYDGVSFTIPMLREDLPNYSREGGFCGVQRRFPDGSKRCVAGSHLGFMYPYSYIGDYYVFICEGFSDGISVWDLGLQSIARPHCRYTDDIDIFLGENIEYVERVIIIPDNDTVGREGAEQLQDVLSELYYYDEEGYEENCDISIFDFGGAKDIRGYIAKMGKQQVKKELLRMI